MGAVLSYISKYCSKAEVKSETYGQMLTAVLTGLDEDDAGKVVFQKLLSKLIVERDWSAQECMHLLLGCKMYSCSRQVVNLNVSWPRSEEVLNSEEMVSDDDMATTCNWIDRYESRLPNVLDDVSLLQLFRHYQWNPHRNQFTRRPNAVRVVNIWPVYQPDRMNLDMYTNYCRVKLQLHHPYRDLQELQTDENGHHIGWIEAYERCIAEHAGLHDEDPLPKERDLVDGTVDDEEFESEEEEEEEDRDARDWQQMARMGPNAQPPRNRDRLGRRDIDVEHNWHASYQLYGPDNTRTSSSYIEDQKRLTTVTNDNVPDVNISDLVGSQRRVFLKVMSHYRAILENGNPPPLRLNIDGTAGTGKSYLIWAITKGLTELAQQHGKPSPVIRVAPTGIAAFNISGSTLHQTFILPKTGFAKLKPGPQLTQFQVRLKDCQYVIFDEKSMIGRCMFGMVESRLREIFPEHDGMFGGRNILLFGDFGQLPPVGDSALFNSQVVEGRGSATALINRGRASYLSLKESITLERVMRQQGEDPETIRFREVLHDLCTNEATQQDCDFLNARFLHQLSADSRMLFIDALHLCPTREMVNEINDNRMTDSGNPVVIVPADHTGPRAKAALADDADGLESKLLLMEGAKVMLTRNIWTQQGLTNGTMGKIGTLQIVPYI